MKPKVRINFAHFWPDFTPAWFEATFPWLTQRYELELSDRPEILIYSCFPGRGVPVVSDRSGVARMPVVKPGAYLRLFLTGENVEPVMDQCDFAISFSALVDHPNHLRLPIWLWGFAPERLVKRADTDWEKIAAEKTHFCNFVYSHDVGYRNDAFRLLERYKRVDAAGRCMNTMDGWTAPGGWTGKIAFIRRYKFTLAIENSIWPGYETEKLIHPVLAGSVPIYVGNPLARNTFDTASYIDIACFRSLRETFDFVREVDNDRRLFLDMLAAPFYRGNTPPDYARGETIAEFFDRVVQAAR
jgi:alpha(1,3/1,4) fucosyltransferase